MTTSPSASSHGFLAGVGAYLLWWFLPLYFPLLHPASPLDISAHRVVWSWIVCLGLLLVTKRFGQYRQILRNRNQFLRLGLAALLLSGNWLIFVIGVLSGRVVEASLGYFINPILTVVLAVVVLGERINRIQSIGIGIAAIGM